jgi:hypothetical protein
MESKKCLQCGNEFQTSINPGMEKKYCSKQCRMKAGNNRRFENLKKTILNEKQDTNILQLERPSESFHRIQRDDIRTSDRFGNISNNHLETIKELYETKSEINFYKLKLEQLEKENIELKNELMEIEIESEEVEENNTGWLSGVEKTLPTLVKSYREDPEATMGFIGSSANMIFNSIFKSKANASSISS